MMYCRPGSPEKPAFEYKYLGGRCRHYKLVGKLQDNENSGEDTYFSLTHSPFQQTGETHGSAGPNHPTVQQIVREMIFGA